MPKKYLFSLEIFFFFILLLPCFAGSALAQNRTIKAANIKNSDYTYQGIDGYTIFLENVCNENTAQLDKKLQKQYKKFILKKNVELTRQLNEKGFLFDTIAYRYLNSIFNLILEKNSMNKSQFHFFVDRTSSVNAYCYEDGTIVCNLGLTTIMENESQIAMVFCHELGHYLLKHVNTTIVKRLEKYNSPEFLAHVNQIKKQKYNTKEQLEDLLLTDIFDRNKHSRSQEKAADSVGMLLFRNTGYDCNSVSRVFDLLDSAESKTTVCTMQDFFKRERISVEREWLRPEKKMSFGAAKNKEITDSLKTHPDCAARKIIMQSFFDKNPKSGAYFLIGSSQQLLMIKKTALFDEADYSKDNDNLGYYLFRLIQNNALFSSNNYIKTEIFNTLQSICKHQKSHTLYMVVSSQYIADDDKDEYIKLLKLLDSVSNEEMATIVKTYYENNKSQINVKTAL